MEHKIVVIGYSGSGKSTMARRLGEWFHCEVLHLDCVHWLPGWRERDRTERNEIVSEFLDTHESWVIDGTYKSACFERRMEEATQIIFLDFPMAVCLYRVLKRYFQYRGKSRESMTKGCEEKIRGEFLWWVVYAGRDKKHKEEFRTICEQYPEKVMVLRSPKKVRKFEEYVLK